MLIIIMTCSFALNIKFRYCSIWFLHLFQIADFAEERKNLPDRDLCSRKKRYNVLDKESEGWMMGF